MSTEKDRASLLGGWMAVRRETCISIRIRLTSAYGWPS